jgi:hypothetical protein
MLGPFSTIARLAVGVSQMDYSDSINQFFGPDTLDKFAARIEQLCHCKTRRPLSDEEHVWRLTALIFAKKWAELHHVTFAWQREPTLEIDEDDGSYQLWRCHLSIGDRYLLCVEGADFGYDEKPGDDGNELWCEAEAALTAMRRVVWPNGASYIDELHDDDEDEDSEFDDD